MLEGGGGVLVVVVGGYRRRGGGVREGGGGKVHLVNPYIFLTGNHNSVINITYYQV